MRTNSSLRFFHTRIQSRVLSYLEKIMRQLLGSFAFLALAIPLIADEKDDAAKKLNGTYELVSAIVEGKPDMEKSEKITLIIKDGTITIKEGDKERDDKAKF